MEVQGVAVGPWLNPALVRYRSGNSPSFEFSRQGNGTRGDGDLELSHLVELHLVFSAASLPAVLRRGKRREEIR